MARRRPREYRRKVDAAIERKEVRRKELFTIHISSENDGYRIFLFGQVVADLIRRANKENMTVLTSETFTNDIAFTIDRVMEKGARIIFVFMYVPEGRQFFCQVSVQNILINSIFYSLEFS